MIDLNMVVGVTFVTYASVYNSIAFLDRRPIFDECVVW
jgi:hypothetical protein